MQDAAIYAPESTEETQQTETTDAALDRLNEYAASAVDGKLYDLGYPVNQNIKLAEFYKWFTDSGVCSVMSNNAGDPFSNNEPYANTLDFEREVIEFFGPHYGFDPDDLAQSIRGQ